MAKIKLKQVGSPIRRPEAQKKILVGLGLGKMHRVVEVEDTPEVRGAIAKLPHGRSGRVTAGPTAPQNNETPALRRGFSSWAGRVAPLARMTRARGSAQGVGRAERRVAGTPYLSLTDGVRGSAALAVLLYHYGHFFMAGPDRRKLPGYLDLYPAHGALWPAYQYGLYAVQVFWLISGFVFAHVYYGHPGGTRSFFANRLARLYPLHILTLLVVTGLQLIALHRLGYTPIYGNFDWQDFGLQLIMAGDWLRRGMSFNGPFWSVSVEVLIYTVFWLSRGLVARLGFPLLVALVVACHFADVRWGGDSRVFACGFYFFSGSTLCLLWRSAWATGWRLGVLGLMLLAGGVGAVAQWGWWGWKLFGITGIFGALFLLLAAVELHAPRRLRDVCEWLGENTYGVYLWHVPIQLTIILILLPGVGPQQVAQNGWFLLLFVALVIAVARFSFVHIERPLRDVLRRHLAAARGHAKGGDKPAVVR